MLENMLDTCIMYFLTHIKSTNYQKRNTHWFAHHLKSWSPLSHTFGKPALRIKVRQIPQRSPRGTLELAGAFRCSLSVFFFFFTTLCAHSFWMTGSSPEYTELCLCTELSLALGLCTRHLLPLSRTPSEPQPTTLQVSALVLYWEGRAAGPRVEPCPPQKPGLSVLECIIL